MESQPVSQVGPVWLTDRTELNEWLVQPVVSEDGAAFYHKYSQAKNLEELQWDVAKTDYQALYQAFESAFLDGNAEYTGLLFEYLQKRRIAFQDLMVKNLREYVYCDGQYKQADTKPALLAVALKQAVEKRQFALVDALMNQLDGVALTEFSRYLEPTLLCDFIYACESIEQVVPLEQMRLSHCRLLATLDYDMVLYLLEKSKGFGYRTVELLIERKETLLASYEAVDMYQIIVAQLAHLLERQLKGPKASDKFTPIKLLLEQANTLLTHPDARRMIKHLHVKQLLDKVIEILQPVEAIIPVWLDIASPYAQFCYSSEVITVMNKIRSMVL